MGKKVMLQLRFVVGDRVKVKEGPKGFDGCADDLAGAIGTIVVPYHHLWHNYVGVQFDKRFRTGHDCSSCPPNYPMFKWGHCRWGNADSLEFIEHGPRIKPLYYKEPGTPTKKGGE